MLQAAAAAVLLLASEAWHSHGALELLAAGAWWRHPAKQPSQCPWSGHAKHSQGKLFTVTTFYTNNIQLSRAAEHGSWHTVVNQHQPLFKRQSVPMSMSVCPPSIPPPGTNSSNLVSTLQLNCHFKASAAYKYHTTTPLIMLTLQWWW